MEQRKPGVEIAPQVRSATGQPETGVLVSQQRGKTLTQGELAVDIPQYDLLTILLIWAAAAVPMGLLGWIVAPALSLASANPGMVRLAVLDVGLIWQFVLVVILLYIETGSLRPAMLARRLWLNGPRSPRTGLGQARLWCWLIPLLILISLYEMRFIGAVDQFWVSLFPAMAEPSGFSLGSALGSPEAKTQMLGAWGFFGLFIVEAVFNTLLGEELLFRGLLLPRMAGAFGRWDWVANGMLFGFYHWHQPWVFVGAAIEGVFLLAYPTKRFKSAWFGIIAHSAQSVFLIFLLLGLVLGLA